MTIAQRADAFSELSHKPQGCHQRAVLLAQRCGDLPGGLGLAQGPESAGDDGPLDQSRPRNAEKFKNVH